jgi:hypothetical protein
MRRLSNFMTCDTSSACCRTKSVAPTAAARAGGGSTRRGGVSSAGAAAGGPWDGNPTYIGFLSFKPGIFDQHSRVAGLIPSNSRQETTRLRYNRIITIPRGGNRPPPRGRDHTLQGGSFTKGNPKKPQTLSFKPITPTRKG